MKKLVLKVAGLKATEVLGREELKHVLGGIGSGSGTGTGSGSGKKPCDGKEVGDGCEFIGSDGAKTYGICEVFFGNLCCLSKRF